MAQPTSKRLVTEAALELYGGGLPGRMAGAESKLGSALYSRGILANGTDWNTLTGIASNGIYQLPSSSTYPNAPFTGAAGSLTVANTATAGEQRAHKMTSNEFHKRTIQNIATSTFNPWERDDAASVVRRRTILPADTSLETLYKSDDSGLWQVTLANAPGHAGWPAGFTFGSLLVEGAGYSSFQLAIEAVTGRIATRYMRNPPTDLWWDWNISASEADMNAIRSEFGVGVNGDLSMDSLHVGDSLTDDVALGADQWGNVLATLTGRNHAVRGWYGQETFEIGVRMGANAYPMTVTGASIPASGTAVTVTGLRSERLAFGGLAGLMARKIPGWLNGRHGNLQNPTNAATMEFTPDDGEAAATPATGTVWFEGDMHDLANRITTIWVGTNDRTEETPERLVSWVQNMIGKQRGHSRVLVFGLLHDVNGTAQAQIDAINTAFQAAFAAAYFDTQSYLITAQAATDAGIVYTAQDDADIAAGFTPTSFRSDTLHLNAAGAKALAYAVHREYVSRGWAV